MDGMRVPAVQRAAADRRRSRSSIWAPSVPGRRGETESSSSNGALGSSNWSRGRSRSRTGSSHGTSHRAPSFAMPAIATSPASVVAASILARLPLAMLTIGLLVHVEHVTGSFAAAGLVSGTLAVAQGAGGPALGRLVDRRGQTAVLLAAALVSGSAAGRHRRPPRRRAADRAARARHRDRPRHPARRRVHARARRPGRRPGRPARRLRDRLRRGRADVGLRPAAGPARRRGWPTGAALAVAGAILTACHPAVRRRRPRAPGARAERGDVASGALRSAGVDARAGPRQRWPALRRRPRSRSPPRPTRSAAPPRRARCSASGASAA